MRDLRIVGLRWIVSAALIALLAMPGKVQAGKLSWLDDVVKEVVREAEVGGKVAVKSADEALSAGKSSGRLFAREAADEGLELVAHRADEISRLAKGAGAAPSEALLQSRFAKLLKPEPEMLRVFKTLAPAEKRLVVEMGEAAQQLAKRFPGQAESMIRELGTEGLAAVRVYGDDVAEILVKEGSSAVGVLRKTGRTGWEFFTSKVLPNKKKLAAAGVLGLFIANPDKFVDTAGNATKYAIEQFSKAGISLAGAMGDGAIKGLGNTFGSLIASLGISETAARVIGIGAAVLVVAFSVVVLVGAPVRWALGPFVTVIRLFRRPKAVR